MSTDTIPRGDAEFDNWFKNFSEYLTKKTSGNPPEWTHIPRDKVTTLNKTYADWHNAYALCLKPHTEVETQGKNTSRKTSEGFVRPFKKIYVDFAPEVSDAQRRAMAVSIRGKPRTADTAPDSIVEILADTSVMRQVSFRYRNAGSKSRGKPRGVHGVEFRCAILDKPPTSIEELTTIEFYTSSPFSIEFTEADRGKKLYYCGRWESNTGKKGPWGAIEMVIIP